MGLLQPCPTPALLSKSTSRERAHPCQAVFPSHGALAEWGAACCPPASSQGCWRQCSSDTPATHYKTQTSFYRQATSSSQCISPAQVRGKWGWSHRDKRASCLPHRRVNKARKSLKGTFHETPAQMLQQRGAQAALPSACSCLLTLSAEL